MVHPTPNRLVRHRHSAFRQQILDVTQAEGEPEVKPYRLLNDLRRETIPAVADLVHPRGATRPPRTPQARSAVTMPFIDQAAVASLQIELYITLDRVERAAPVCIDLMKKRGVDWTAHPSDRD